MSSSDLKKESDFRLVQEELSDQELVRLEKWKKLREKGIDVFPHRAEQTHSVFEVVRDFFHLSREELEEKQYQVKVPGRIIAIRKMGRATFFHISDFRDRVQVYLREDLIGPENYELFDLFDIGDFIQVEGRLFRTRTGELTILAEKIIFLAKCFHPLPEKWHGLQDIELRYRKRYLDLIMNPESGETFRIRSELIKKIRQYFDERGFIEVETPMMHVMPGGALARPFKTFHQALGINLYLRIAPELYLKRLVVGGMERVYEINRSFRNEGVDSQHNPEFTMLEFYQAYIDFNQLMEMTEDLFLFLAREIHGHEELPYGDNLISFQKPWPRLKFKEAILQYSGLSADRLEDEKEMMELAGTLTPEAKPATYAKALDIIFDKMAKEKIIQPTFIINPPKEISPLAKANRQNPAEADRFELLIAGMELANAFSELTDPFEQRQRFEEQAAMRKTGDEESHLVDLDYVEALEYGLPPTGGEGIGIDRLTMIFTNQKSIREVILFPLLKPR
ncbi:MAG TPA: lysine--tRNA ligase [Candidatus Saccharicenans sp.]|jgi:lysyl-tRNA synthetase class 2|nr:lysine--tRNA ligase [Candidatus Saccharicenans sp.]HPC88555.1 lysine--tRNA ligase [Candidatus Saccharicenans sp.]HRT25876.1 lysine--tRNA ligase [Candidatus Saccharicenans sp.]HRV06158.1 lysine--tRNA ligase [Candidatus Saccharicenans sp.]